MKKGQPVERLDGRPAAVQQSRGMFLMCCLCRECLLADVRSSDFAFGHPLDSCQAALDIYFDNTGGFVDPAHKAAVAVTDFSHGLVLPAKIVSCGKGFACGLPILVVK